MRLAGLVLVLPVLAAAVAARAGAGDITVFAAASLGTALQEVAADFQAETGYPVTLSHAGSSALARQIQHGAPADLFVSANPGWMDVLQEAGLIQPESRVDLLGNSLVLVAHGADPAPVAIAPGFDLAGLLGDGRLAMALVDAVPAGLYGRAALESLGVWAAVAPRVAQADNVRAALALVAAGEAPYGIVYATDALAEDAVGVVATFPPATHPPIVYPAALVAGRDDPRARRFLDYLRGPAARAAFERHGFTVPGG